MSEITVTVPDPELKSFVHDVVKKDGLTSEGEYILNLIRDDRRRRAKMRLEALLLEGLEGDPIPVDAEFWAQMRREFNERHPPEAPR